MVAVIWLVLGGTGKIVLLNNFLQAMLSGVAAFFQTQTIHRFRARLTMSALLSFHYTLRARACLWTAFWKDIDSLDFPKIKNKLKHFTGHRMDPLIQLCSSLNG